MIRYETGNWPSSRRCGYKWMVEYHYTYRYHIGTTDGDYKYYDVETRQYCECSSKSGPHDLGSTRDLYAAICDCVWPSTLEAYHKNKSCPKGWGRSKYHYPSDSYSVRAAQGYNRSGTSVPVYGYVTRYRDAYYNYIAGRVSKA